MFADIHTLTAAWNQSILALLTHYCWANNRLILAFTGIVVRYHSGLTIEAPWTGIYSHTLTAAWKQSLKALSTHFWTDKFFGHAFTVIVVIFLVFSWTIQVFTRWLFIACTFVPVSNLVFSAFVFQPRT